MKIINVQRKNVTIYNLIIECSPLLVGAAVNQTETQLTHNFTSQSEQNHEISHKQHSNTLAKPQVLGQEYSFSNYNVHHDQGRQTASNNSKAEASKSSYVTIEINGTALAPVERAVNRSLSHQDSSAANDNQQQDDLLISSESKPSNVVVSHIVMSEDDPLPPMSFLTSDNYDATLNNSRDASLQADEQLRSEDFDDDKRESDDSHSPTTKGTSDGQLVDVKNFMKLMRNSMSNSQASFESSTSRRPTLSPKSKKFLQDIKSKRKQASLSPSWGSSSARPIATSTTTTTTQDPATSSSLSSPVVSRQEDEQEEEAVPAKPSNLTESASSKSEKWIHYSGEHQQTAAATQDANQEEEDQDDARHRVQAARAQRTRIPSPISASAEPLDESASHNGQLSASSMSRRRRPLRVSIERQQHLRTTTVDNGKPITSESTTTTIDDGTGTKTVLRHAPGSSMMSRGADADEEDNKMPAKLKEKIIEQFLKSGGDPQNIIVSDTTITTTSQSKKKTITTVYKIVPSGGADLPPGISEQHNKKGKGQFPFSQYNAPFSKSHYQGDHHDDDEDDDDHHHHHEDDENGKYSKGDGEKSWRANGKGDSSITGTAFGNDLANMLSPKSQVRSVTSPPLTSTKHHFVPAHEDKLSKNKKRRPSSHHSGSGGKKLKKIMVTRIEMPAPQEAELLLPVDKERDTVTKHLADVNNGNDDRRQDHESLGEFYSGPPEIIFGKMKVQREKVEEQNVGGGGDVSRSKPQFDKHSFKISQHHESKLGIKDDDDNNNQQQLMNYKFKSKEGGGDLTSHMEKSVSQMLNDHLSNSKHPEVEPPMTIPHDEQYKSKKNIRYFDSSLSSMAPMDKGVTIDKQSISKPTRKKTTSTTVGSAQISLKKMSSSEAANTIEPNDQNNDGGTAGLIEKTHQEDLDNQNQREQNIEGGEEERVTRGNKSNDAAEGSGNSARDGEASSKSSTDKISPSRTRTPTQRTRHKESRVDKESTAAAVEQQQQKSEQQSNAQSEKRAEVTTRQKQSSVVQTQSDLPSHNVQKKPPSSSSHRKAQQGSPASTRTAVSDADGERTKPDADNQQAKTQMPKTAYATKNDNNAPRGSSSRRRTPSAAAPPPTTTSTTTTSSTTTSTTSTTTTTSTTPRPTKSTQRVAPTRASRKLAASSLPPPPPASTASTTTRPPTSEKTNNSRDPETRASSENDNKPHGRATLKSPALISRSQQQQQQQQVESGASLLERGDRPFAGAQQMPAKTHNIMMLIDFDSPPTTRTAQQVAPASNGAADAGDLIQRPYNQQLVDETDSPQKPTTKLKSESFQAPFTVVKNGGGGVNSDNQWRPVSHAGVRGKQGAGSNLKAAQSGRAASSQDDNSKAQAPTVSVQIYNNLAQRDQPQRQEQQPRVEQSTVSLDADDDIGDDLAHQQMALKSQVQQYELLPSINSFATQAKTTMSSSATHDKSRYAAHALQRVEPFRAHAPLRPLAYQQQQNYVGARDHGEFAFPRDEWHNSSNLRQVFTRDNNHHFQREHHQHLNHNQYHHSQKRDPVSSVPFLFASSSQQSQNRLHHQQQQQEVHAPHTFSQQQVAAAHSSSAPLVLPDESAQTNRMLMKVIDEIAKSALASGYQVAADSGQDARRPLQASSESTLLYGGSPALTRHEFEEDELTPEDGALLTAGSMPMASAIPFAQGSPPSAPMSPSELQHLGSLHADMLMMDALTASIGQQQQQQIRGRF